MNRLQNALVIFAEEIVELATEFFQWSGYPNSNHDRLLAEYNDVIGAALNLHSFRVSLNIDARVPNGPSIGVHEVAAMLLELHGHVSKAIRFGIDEQRDLPTSNRERIIEHWNKVWEAIHSLRLEGIEFEPSDNRVAKKLIKIERYTLYSESLGAVK